MESQISFILNQETISVKINAAFTLLDFIRKKKLLTGTKEVCKEGDCGACSILIGEIQNNKLKYKIVNSCLFPIHYANNKHVVTIEGLNQNELSPIQKIFVNNNASQCGFCTPGFIISLTNYLINCEKFDIEKAINSIAGNICRCTGYNSIKKSVIILGNSLKLNNKKNRINNLVELGFLPSYFNGIKKLLRDLNNKESSKNKIVTRSNLLIGGGTDLFVQTPNLIVKYDLSFLSDFLSNQIYLRENIIYIGGSTTIEDFKSSPIINKYLSPIVNHLDLFASLQIRNIATISGNIINASPIADLTNILLSLNANVHLIDNRNNKRIIELHNFYKGYKELNKNKEEIIEEISIQIPNKKFRFNFEKVSKRKYMDIASVNTSILIIVKNRIIHNVRISAGGVAPIPLYLKKSSEFLINKLLNKKTILGLIEIVKTEISPISDIRGSKEYKELLLAQLIKAHFIKLFPNKISVEDLL